MQLIDTHSHLYANKFQPDMAEVVLRCKEVLSHVFLPNIDLDSVEALHVLADRDPAFFFPMMGLHPCYVKEDWQEVIAKMEELWEQRNYFGVGETGLDLYWDKTTLAIQQESLRVHCRWAKEKELPLILHGRSATPELIELIREEQDGRLKGIFHCFVDGVEEAKQVIDLGFLIGIGGVLTYKNSGLAATMKEVDLQHIVLETDSPYLPPVPYRGKRNESSYLPIIARKLADAKEMGMGEVARRTTENAMRLFDLEPVNS